ncbi:MAG: hypothetical protein M3N93_14535, partial [Acidobacteriota bacterium]|nr:hypothetical protein [Acidobacteriota bacterium]
ATSNALVTGNLCRSCGQWAWQLNWGSHNRIENNIFDLSTPGTRLGLYQDFEGLHRMTANVLTRNLIYVSEELREPLYVVNLMDGDMPIAASQNLYFSASGVRIPNEPPVVDVSPLYENPRFRSPETGDYTMPSTSPAHNKIGFQPLATDQGPLPAQKVSSNGQHPYWQSKRRKAVLVWEKDRLPEAPCLRDVREVLRGTEKSHRLTCSNCFPAASRGGLNNKTKSRREKPMSSEPSAASNLRYIPHSVHCPTRMPPRFF